jgi:hypothetical protein
MILLLLAWLGVLVYMAVTSKKWQRPVGLRVSVHGQAGDWSIFRPKSPFRRWT